MLKLKECVGLIARLDLENRIDKFRDQEAKCRTDVVAEQ